MAESTEEFLARARKRFAIAAEEEKHLRDKFVSDLKFASPDGDDQWDPLVKQQREAAGRPAMAFPRCHTFVQQVANEARQNKPQIKFSPRLDADKDTADVYEGLARFIQYTSDAQIAYETAIEYSAAASFGFYRILTDYADDETIEDEKPNQEIRIAPIYDPLTVYGILVPACFGREPKYAFVVEDVPKDEYEAQYGKDIAGLTWTEAEKKAEGWIGSDTVRVAEYWYVEETKQEGKKRPKRTVKFCKTNGLEVLEDSETDWPGSTIPIIPVLGKQVIVEGKPKLFSVVRPQKAAQQLINYSKSRIAETLSTAPVSPFMVATGQIPSGKEAQWANLNKTLTPYLEYAPVDAAGRPAPPPARQVYEPPIQSLSEFVAQEIEDLKATTGIFDASLGNQGNETSGQAIMRRQQQSNLATMHYMDNLERSFRKAGDVISELIPLIYDTPRVIQIMGEDEAQKVVQINQPHKDEFGKPKHFDMTKGKYNVVVTMGRAFSTKRMESFDMMQQLVQSAPNLLPMFGDVLFKNSDMAGSDIVAERFHAMLPPAFQNKENPIPPEAQAQIAQAQQQMGAMQQELQKLQFERQAKVVEHQGKVQQIQLQAQADMALEDKRLENSLAIAEVNTKAQSASERQQLFADLWSQFHDQAHDIASQAAQQAHERAMAQIQAQNQAQLAQQQAQNQSAQSAQDAAQSQAVQQAQPAGAD